MGGSNHPLGSQIIAVFQESTMPDAATIASWQKQIDAVRATASADRLTADERARIASGGPISIPIELDADLASLYDAVGGHVRPLTHTDVLILQVLRLLRQQGVKSDVPASNDTTTSPAEPVAIGSAVSPSESAVP